MRPDFHGLPRTKAGGREVGWMCASVHFVVSV